MSTAFVLAHTSLAPVPLVPEVRLQLADEAIELWQYTEKFSGGVQLPPPFWAFAWAGGQALARHVLDNPDLVRGRRVLDVAAGSGLVAIAAMKAGAAQVTAVEIDPLAVTAMAINAARERRDVDARSAGRPRPGDGGDADVVLAGDVFYSREMTGQVLEFLRPGRGARRAVWSATRAGPTCRRSTCRAGRRV